jgi:tetratricopeptide (TPR) repeat protein
MSVEEARNIVLEVAKPPVLFLPYPGASWENNYNVNIRTTSIKIIGKKRYSIPLEDLEPSASIIDSGMRNGHIEVFLSKRQAFWENSALSDEQATKRFIDALLVLKSAATKFTQDEEALFQESARNYRASAVKPQLPEDARRFRVMAEGAVSDKELDTAADFYEQALGVAPWWPGGHFNRALVLSETGDYVTAIFEMKRYLLLVPNAPDARAAQDMIYAWQGKEEEEEEEKAVQAYETKPPPTGKKTSKKHKKKEAE